MVKVEKKVWKENYFAKVRRAAGGGRREGDGGVLMLVVSLVQLKVRLWV